MVDPTGDGFDSDSAWYRSVFSTEFNFMEPGNQLKWGYTEPSQSTYNFAPADSLVSYAASTSLKVRGHNLLWGVANPAWVFNGAVNPATNWTGDQLKAFLIDHIQQVMGHYKTQYPGVVTSWDVTNEIMGWNNYFNGDGIVWTKIGTNPPDGNSDGADYARIAFATARAADPNATLCMDDWGNGGDAPSNASNINGVDKTQNMIDAVRMLKAEGVPIDCAGFEAHSTSATYAAAMSAMKAYADMGVQVQVTEFDNAVPSTDTNADTETANKVTTILKACVDSSNCTMFDLWGFAKKYPALANQSGAGYTYTYPWDASSQKTPEYNAMLYVLGGGAVDFTPPSAPTNVVATGTSQTEIDLSWTASTDNVGVTSYIIFRNGVQVGTSSINSYADTGLNPSTLYGYTIKATDAQGNLSAASASVNGATQAGATTNLIMQSQAFENAAWGKQQLTSVIANATTSPDSTLTADELIESANPGIHQVLQNPTLTSGAAYTFSVYAKAGTRSWIGVNLQDSSPKDTYFYLGNGVVGSVGAGSTASITSVGNGWYRCVITTTVNQPSNYAAIFMATSATNGTIGTYTGDGASGVYLWGAQLQQGSFVTGYVPNP
jgi:endo-1,4-beta-xylanase